MTVLPDAMRLGYHLRRSSSSSSSGRLPSSRLLPPGNHHHKPCRRGAPTARVAHIDPPPSSPSPAPVIVPAGGGVDDPSLLAAAAAASSSTTASTSNSNSNSSSSSYRAPSPPRAQSPPRASSRPASPVDLLTSFVSDLATAATRQLAGGAGGGNDDARPLVPEVDLNAVLGQMLGTDDRAGATLASSLAADDGPPRLFTPNLPELRGPNGTARDAAALPLMFYLPGIDGTGLAAFKQFPRLMASFDLRCLIIPPGDRLPFEELAARVEGALRAQVEADGAGRPVYLLGESFGGVLSLALAPRLGDLVDRLVLVNPATAFARSPWPQAGPLLPMLPEDAYKLLPFALAPLLSDPLQMAAHAVDARAPALRQASDLAYGLLELVPELAALRRVLPRDTLAHRLDLLRQGCAYLTDARLRAVQQRALVVAAGRDLLIPSKDEAERLKKALPRCRARVVEGRSHALLQEAGVDLVDILKAEGFYAPRRVLSNGAQSTGARGGGGTAFGTPAPIQLPTPAELRRDADDGFVGVIRRLTSPVYYSTLPDGRIVRGFDGVPRRAAADGAADGSAAAFGARAAAAAGAVAATDRPLVFVGPHGLAALDMYVMIPDLVSELGILPRGLAHPIIFAGGKASSDGADSSGSGSGSGSSSNGSSSNSGGPGDPSFGSLLATYGAVPVGPFSMHRLLAAGDNVLLYPGGAREAFKRKGEAHQLMWPEQAEFVRLAAKFGATIVPFAAVGADEAVGQLLDIDEVAALRRAVPWLARDDEGSRMKIPAARVGVNAGRVADVESFGLPLVAPTIPPRFYFLFGAPVATDPALASDRAACAALYSDIRASVEGGMGYLLRKRAADPYGDFFRRAAYEASWGWERRAPSFDPDQ